MVLTPLTSLRPGEKGKIKEINGTGLFFTRLRSLGMRSNADVTVVRQAPFGGPLHVRIGERNDIALSQDEAAHIVLAVA